MFIVLESIDGGGKGRQREELVKYLENKDIQVKSAEFPDHSTPIWDEYLHPALHGEKHMTPGAWFSAFAMEKFLWEEELKKFKGDKNNIFIADGYYTTTLVYQCIIQNKPSLEFGIQFAEQLSIVKPDLAIYLDVHPKTALARKSLEEGKEKKDMFEEDLEKQVWIQAAFQKMVKEQVWCPWKQVDGNGSIHEVRDATFAEIRDIMGWP
ncbi:hypothetical protein KC717_03645 [Candidatus Dojkabacteria bacterium]|uniref:Thymidylate kinase-like domain-containing protein n=1 Tax=Candidatus Dojkabacteria bacterium TaxID=2099670 RepID=A0A955L804_9BACT|nr:hypothetical protein [Candidatus Dojkabacteria bacterium]